MIRITSFLPFFIVNFFSIHPYDLLLMLLGVCVFSFSSCQPKEHSTHQSKNKHVNTIPVTFIQDVEHSYLQLDSTMLTLEVLPNEFDVPWDINYGPDQWLWLTEQKGVVSRIHPQNGEQQRLLQLEDVHYKKSRGLLSMALHPEWDRTPFVYLHYTFSYLDHQKKENILSRLTRYKFEGDTLLDPQIILDSIPGKSYHNGSRMLFTSDHKLLLSTGDAGNKEGSQDLAFLGGKILRMNPDGSVPSDNPIPGSLIYTYGHRNAQGLTYGRGQIYSSEHGPNNDDEVNLLIAGKNYGWPEVEGYCDNRKEEAFCNQYPIQEPLKAWTPTIAVAGIAYFDHPTIPEWQHSILSVNLKGRALRVLTLDQNGKHIQSEHIYLQRVLGRMRDICVSPRGEIFLTTSNMDWHPRLQSWLYDTLPPGPDRIIRLTAVEKEEHDFLVQQASNTILKEEQEPIALATENWSHTALEDDLSKGQQLYLQHCASCHRPDGLGAEGLIPPLARTDWVIGDKARLIQIMLQGLSEKIEVNGQSYEQEMPSYDHLADEEIAHILSYIRKDFGNKASAIRAEEVAEERRGTTI